MAPLMQTDFPGLKLLGRGKVRDNYDLGDALLIVSTDRISAFDHILPNGIPDKGKVLNQISLFWFERTAAMVRNHVKQHRVERFPEPLRKHSEILRGRSVVVTRLDMLPVECVVRGYLAGSGFKEYKKTGAVCGVKLPAGLEDSSRLPEPIFTPSTKAVTGHDENIPFATVVDLVGRKTAEQVRDVSLAIYKTACEYAETRGIIIADTKFEFGRDGDTLVLADEVLTPDSSRFWPKDTYRPGRAQPSLDKQYVRDYLESIGWDKNPPAPRLPDEIVEGTQKRYLDIFKRLTDRSLE
ncbi:MAG TPA: phosphoribosylaminoimidazolesuccinocarboxamide synthase [Candidatus Polarisedimenticolia bacterium]|nr:phosphoribosylaminoimidazolesuccinocarboxamide synthase [Candidatus Polarisedimenticolia bacterium]